MLERVSIDNFTRKPYGGSMAGSKDHVRVWPDGHTEMGIGGPKTDFKSQLLAIRTLQERGWVLSNPKNWEEAES